MALPELIINAVSAGGAVAAAAVALAIATRDRRERHRERLAADRAQARLILIEPKTLLGSLFYRIDVHNHGRQPILDVVIGQVRLSGHPARWKLNDGSDALIRIIRPETEEAFHSFPGEFVNPDGTPIAQHTSDSDGNRRYPDKPDPALVYAEITFTDANGNMWELDTEGHLTHKGTAD